MTELKRWLDDGPPDEIRRLLAVGRDENAPPRLLGRTLVALGTTSATAAASASGASAAAKLGMLGIALKWGGAGLVSGTLVAGAVAGVTRMAATHAAARAHAHVALGEPTAPATNPSPDLPRPGSVTRTATDDATATTTAMDTAPPTNTPPNGATVPNGATTNTATVSNTPSVAVPTPSVAVPTPSVTVPTPPVTVHAPSVTARAFPDSSPATAREVALIDAARAALRRGDGDGTLRLLSDYERHFSPAHLEPEVLYLRMQAAKTRGDDAGARRAATQIVTQYPRSPEVGRAEELLRASTSAPKE